MLDEEEIEQEVRVLMYELMMVLYQHGIREVHVGGMMRLLGVSNESSSAMMTKWSFWTTSLLSM
jgi:hypothetical protein